MTDPSSRTLRLGPFETALPEEAAARAAFATRRALAFPDALDDTLLARLMALCDRAAFASNMVEGLGHREVERPPLAGTAMMLALRREPLFRWLERVTGCGPIGTVEGRVVQTWPVAGDELVWHDDLDGKEVRRLGVTVALGNAAFEGGLFELRGWPGREPLLAYKHDRAGAMLVFEVSERCEHRVHPLQSGGPRRVFTGWFIA